MSQYNLFGHYFRLNDEILECIADATGQRFATFRNIYTFETTNIRKEFVIEDYEFLDRSAHNMMRG
jgi:hypothetical protein